jgi:hypothetical protein
MNRGWLGPIAELVESWLDDSVSAETYQHFLQRNATQLGHALTEPVDQAAWAAEVSLALDNLRKTSFHIDAPSFERVDPSLELPAREQAHNWFEEHSASGLVSKGTVERFTAAHLLTLIQEEGGPELNYIGSFLEALLRHVELRRKNCLQLRGRHGPSDRWFEVHDTAILLSRWAGRSSDIRYLNAAMKLNDWALVVHRRSVPPNLLARYMLSISEVQHAFEVLI